MGVKKLNQGSYQEGKQMVFGGQSFLVIDRVSDVNEVEILNNDAMLLNIDDSDELGRLVRLIRKHANPGIYLKPLFVTNSYLGSKAYLIHCDGQTDVTSLAHVAHKSSVINRRVQEISTTRSLGKNQEAEALNKAMQYAYTRNVPLKPSTSRASEVGYEYPIASLFFEGNGHQLVRMLRSADKNGWVKPELEDKVHLCNSCQGSYLHFRETCPKCSSIDIQSHDVIHHFSCATVASETAFKQGEHLVCPKCDKTLRHIGVDYDKPSVVYDCNDCETQFQQPDMKAYCVDCHNENGLEELEELDIQAYGLTQEGIKRLKEGWAREEGLEDTRIPEGMVSNEFFRMLCQQEKKRVQHANGKSTIGTLSINKDKMDLLNPTRKKHLQEELAGILMEYLDDMDVLTVSGEGKFEFLMPEAAEAQVSERLSNLKFNLNRLLDDNLSWGENAFEISTEALHSGGLSRVVNQ